MSANFATEEICPDNSDRAIGSQENARSSAMLFRLYRLCRLKNDLLTENHFDGGKFWGNHSRSQLTDRLLLLSDPGSIG